MINQKQFKLLFFLLFLFFSTIHFYQLSNQHWSGFLDQDLIIIYNSLLINAGYEQEYRDHPAFTTFLINSLFYRIFNFLFNYSNDIDLLLKSENINNSFQIYFIISRIVNFSLNILLVFLFSKIIKSLKIERYLRYLICLIFIISIGFISSLFLLRSENVSLLFLSLSIYLILLGTNKKNLIFFLSGISLSFAMLAKIQIIFLATYLIFLIPHISFKKESINKNKKNLLDNYFILSFILIILIFFIFQIYIQNFARFERNQYLDPIIFFIGLIGILIFFYYKGKFKKNIIYLSSLINGFAFVIIVLLFLDKFDILKLNHFILLRLTNPFHYMTEFTGDMANGPVDINFLIQSFVKFFSKYNFNLIELFLILSLFAINIKSKNYFFMIFFIFVINTFVMNFRYLPTYHLYYIFIYLIFFSILLKMLKFNLSLKIVNFAVLIFFINSINFFFIKDHNYNFKKIFSRDIGFINICKELQHGIKPKTYENIEYIQYYHKKFDDRFLKKICKEII